MENVQGDTGLFGLRLLVIQKSMGRVMGHFIFIPNPNTMDEQIPTTSTFFATLWKKSYHPNFLISPLKGVGKTLFSWHRDLPFLVFVNRDVLKNLRPLDAKSPENQTSRPITTLPRFWDWAKIFQDPHFLRKHSITLSVLSVPPTAAPHPPATRDQPNMWPRSNVPTVNVNIPWKMITMILLNLLGDYQW